MTVRSGGDANGLPLALVRQLNEVCRRFEEAWRAASAPEQRPRIETFLGAVPDMAHASLVRELVALELELRCGAGEQAYPDDYRKRFPSLYAPNETTMPFPVRELGASPGADAHIPGYEIIQELGRGGMGVVYWAWQSSLCRPVALKMILGGAHAGAQELARFRIEAEAVARLQHPNIVQVYEVGHQGPCPYMVLEYVDGGGLAKRMDGTPQAARTAAQLVATLAEAIHYAHERGIVHRDLTPANILLTADGVPKITDFGLAKLVIGGGPTLTCTAQVLGTPSYMSPEQAEGKTSRVGPASDVYALGAILYQMLTGQPPFKGETPMETLLQVRHKEPLSPTRLQPKLPRDLATITLKCLHKEADKRYSSALALAEDLKRWMAGVAIHARPTGIGERAVKWARRRPAIAVLLLLVVLVAAAGFSGVLWQWQQAESARARADENADKETQMRHRAEEAQKAEAEQRAQVGVALKRTESTLYSYQLARAEQLWAANNVRQAEQMLDHCRPDQRGWEWDYLKRLCHADERTLHATSAPLSVACSPDGKQLAAAGFQWMVQIWDSATGRPLFKLPSPQAIPCIAYRPDSKELASACADHTITIWDPIAGRQIRNWRAHKDAVNCLAYSSDGRRLASGGADGMVHVWDPAKSELQFTLKTKEAGPVNSVAFSPDGRLLASAHAERHVLLWDLATKAPCLSPLKARNSSFLSVAFHPSGAQLAAAGGVGDTYLWDVSTGKELRVLIGHRNVINSIAFSPDGKLLATASWDSTVKVWDLALPNAPPITMRGHAEKVTCVAFHPGGQRLVSGAYDQTVKVWPLLASQECQVLGHSGGVQALKYSPDGHLLATGCWDASVKLWDLATGRVLHSLKQDGSVDCLAFSPDGRRLASGGTDPRVKIWDVPTGRELGSLAGHIGTVRGIEFSPDGTLIACADDSAVKVWKLSDSKLLSSHPSPRDVKNFLFYDVTFSPDGGYLVAAGGNNSVVGIISVWDIVTGRETRSWRAHNARVKRILFSPDHRVLASVGFDKEVIFWDWAPDSATNRIRMILQGHNDWISDIAFSPDGKRLATASFDQTTKLWDLETGKETLTLPGHGELIYGVAFSPDGRRLATGGEDRKVRIWDATPLGAERSAGWLLDERLAGSAGAVFSADGQLLATARENGGIQLWNTTTGWPTILLPGHDSVVQSILFSPDGTTLATSAQAANQTSEVKLWDLPAGTERRMLRIEQKDVRVLAFLPGGGGLATLSDDGVTIWDEAGGQVRQSLRARRPTAGKPERLQAGVVSPDGRFFVAGGEQGTLYVWDTVGGREQLLPADPSPVIGLELSPDGRWLISGTVYYGVRVWDTATWQEHRRFDTQFPIRSLSLAADGRTLALGDDAGIVERWDLQTGRRLGNLYGYSWEGADHVRFSPVGNLLAVAARNGSLKLWTSATLQVPSRTRR